MIVIAISYFLFLLSLPDRNNSHDYLIELKCYLLYIFINKNLSDTIFLQKSTFKPIY